MSKQKVVIRRRPNKQGSRGTVPPGVPLLPSSLASSSRSLDIAPVGGELATFQESSELGSGRRVIDISPQYLQPNSHVYIYPDLVFSLTAEPIPPSCSPSFTSFLIIRVLRVRLSTGSRHANPKGLSRPLPHSGTWEHLPGLGDGPLRGVAPVSSPEPLVSVNKRGITRTRAKSQVTRETRQRCP